MPLFRPLRFAARSRVVGKRRVRGLSTAELVGIIVIVGILGFLSTTFITNLVGSSKTSAGNENAHYLNTVLTSALSSGVDLDTSNSDAVIAALNSGVSTGTGANELTFRVSPPILNPGSYSLNSATNLFSYIDGKNP